MQYGLTKLISNKGNRNNLLRWLYLTLFAINAGLVAGYFGLWFLSAREGLSWRADFTMYYTAIKMLQSGDADRLYDLDLQSYYQQQILEGRSFKDGLLPYNYPPYVAVVLLPFGLLPLTISYYVFTIFQVILIIVWITQIAKLTRKWSWTVSERIMLIVSVLAFPPLLTNLLIGNLALFVTVCITLFYIKLKSEEEISAGLWLFLSTFKPQHAIIPVMIIISAKRWKILLTCILSGIMIIFVCSLIFPAKIWLEFVKTLIQMSGIMDQYGITVWGMYNLKGAVVLLFGSETIITAQVLNWIAFFLSILVTFYIWRNQYRIDHGEFGFWFAFCLTFGLIGSPHLYPQDGLLLVLPAILFYQYLRGNRKSKIGFSILVLVTPLLSLIFQFLPKNIFPFHFPFLIAVMLLVWMLISIIIPHKPDNMEIDSTT